MLGLIEISALKLQSHLFLWLYPCPIQWKSDYNGIKISQPSTSSYKLIPWSLSFIWLGVNLILLLYESIVYRNLSPKPDFERINVIIFLSCFAMLTFVLSVSITMLTLKETTVEFNTCLQMKKDMNTRFMHSSPKEDSIGMLLFLISLFGGITPIFLTTTAVLLKIDPFYFFLKYEIFPSEKVETVLFYLIEGVLIFPCVAECARLLVVTTSYLIILLQSISSIAFALDKTRNRLSISSFKRWYSRITILYKILEPVLNIIMYLAITFCFWGTVIYTWLLTKGFGKIGMSIYSFFAFMLIWIVGGNLITLPKYAGAGDRFVEMVKRNLQRAREQHVKLRTKETKIALLEAKGIPPIKFKCGPFLFINLAFLTEHYFLVTQRVFDAILIFDYECE
ncbi:unnamed protein product [Orchesella dallaii]|uniref:Gustatory receptor n=1 Tax=Orchesella dallaii TaxID=48710 RepID=A0ABP1Q2Y4_9HEXA